MFLVSLVVVQQCTKHFVFFFFSYAKRVNRDGEVHAEGMTLACSPEGVPEADGEA